MRGSAMHDRRRNLGQAAVAQSSPQSQGPVTAPRQGSRCACRRQLIRNSRAQYSRKRSRTRLKKPQPRSRPASQKSSLPTIYPTQLSINRSKRSRSRSSVTFAEIRSSTTAGSRWCQLGWQRKLLLHTPDTGKAPFTRGASTGIICAAARRLRVGHSHPRVISLAYCHQRAPGVCV
jgi:hypothetical protein